MNIPTAKLYRETSLTWKCEEAILSQVVHVFSIDYIHFFLGGFSYTIEHTRFLPIAPLKPV